MNCTDSDQGQDIPHRDNIRQEDLKSLRQRNAYLERQHAEFINSPIGRAYFLVNRLITVHQNTIQVWRRLRRHARLHGLKAALSLVSRRIDKTARATTSQFDVTPPSVTSIPSQLENRTMERRLKISWMVYGHLPNGGGHRNIYRMAYHLERFGHDVSLYITDTNFGTRALSDAIRTKLYPIAGKIEPYNGRIERADVLIGTHWESIKYVKAHRDLVNSVCYFVQDYEPYFYPMGSSHLLAQETYKQDFFHICSGEWVYRKISMTHGSKGGHFVFPIDRAVYRDRGQSRKKNSIVFFAKPEMERRCFEIGKEALEHLFRLRQDFEVVLFGSNKIRDYRYRFPCRLVSFARNIDELAELYNEHEIGMAFSTTNPSLVPYEMMASGMVVVDLYTELSEYNYGGNFDTAVLCRPNPEQLAHSINALLNAPDEIHQRRARGAAFTSHFPTEEQSARTVERYIKESLANR